MASRQKGYKNPRLTGSTGIFNPRVQPKQPAGTPYNRAAPPPSAPMRGGLLREAAKQRARAPGAGAPPVPETKYPIRPQPAPQPARSTIGAGDEARRAAAARMEGFQPIGYGGQPEGGSQQPPEQFGPQFTPGMGMPDQGPPQSVTPAPMEPIVTEGPGLGPMYPMAGAAPEEGTPGEAEPQPESPAPAPEPEPTAPLPPPPGGPKAAGYKQKTLIGYDENGNPVYSEEEYIGDAPSVVHEEDATTSDPYMTDAQKQKALEKATAIDQAHQAEMAKMKPESEAEGQSQNIQEYILDLKDIADSGAAREQKLQEQKGVFLEAIDRMIREAALRRMGSAGIIGKGFGAIAGKFAKEMNATAIEDKRLEVEAMANAINAYVTLHGNELEGETKAALLEAQDTADKLSQFHAEMNNILADTESDGFSGKGYTQMYEMFHEFVMGGVENPETGAPWTTAEIFNKFYVKRKSKFWWNGMKPDGSYDPELKDVKMQLAGQNKKNQRDILWEMMIGVKDTNPEYFEALKAYRDSLAT